MQGEITFHLSSGKCESWIITEHDFEQLLAEIMAQFPRVLRLVTVNDGREVLVCQERIEAVEFSLINAGVVRQGEVVTENRCDDLPDFSVMEELSDWNDPAAGWEMVLVGSAGDGV